MPVTLQVIRTGSTTTTTPFTICIIANPLLEAPWRSGALVLDPVIANRHAFDGCVQYIVDALFQALPGQAEPLLRDPAIEPHVRVVAVFETGITPADPNADAFALVGQDPASTLLVPRRRQCHSFARRHGIDADVIYAVSASESHQRASAYYTSDDDSRTGVAFDLDGVTMHHRHHALLPGTIGISVTARALTAVHEFQHAISSYSNGSITDLYVPVGHAVNSRIGRPIPADFASYEGGTHLSDPYRDGIGYPPGWRTYHCALIDPSRPAIMDDYWAAVSPVSCQNDTITRMFVRDRVLAKISRPSGTTGSGLVSRSVPAGGGGVP